MGQIDKNLKNELFKVAIDYIYREHLVGSQGELAEKIGISASALSRIMNDKKFVGDDTLRKMNEAFGGIFNMAYFRGEDPHCMLMEDLAYYKQHPEERLVFDKPQEVAPTPQQQEMPDYVQRLFEEAVRMSTRNELLERQCEKLIGELREAKSDNDTFIEELRKSKEFNDTLAAELKISRTQNENLITELRETRKELQTAINGIETMKNQMAMMMTTPQPSTVFPTTVNEEGTIQLVIPDIIGHDTKSKKKLRDQVYALIPQGYIRGGRPIITDELAKEALKAFKQPKKK